jgi:hypothetical protein
VVGNTRARASDQALIFDRRRCKFSPEICPMPAVRHPVVDDLFCAAAPVALRAQVAGCVAAIGAEEDAARPSPELLVTPHAGCEYSGAVARSFATEVHQCPSIAI